MAEVVAFPLQFGRAEISGETHSPEHKWSIHLGPGSHCYLYVDGAYVLHGTMEKCSKYLFRLEDDDENHTHPYIH